LFHHDSSQPPIPNTVAIVDLQFDCNFSFLFDYAETVALIDMIVLSDALEIQGSLFSIYLHRKSALKCDPDEHFPGMFQCVILGDKSVRRIKIVIVHSLAFP
jgi:hypothetical protein